MRDLLNFLKMSLNKFILPIAFAILFSWHVAQAQDLSDQLSFYNSSINWSHGSSNLTEESKAALAHFAALLQDYKNSKFEIKVFTDSSGSAIQNQNLSEMRAQALANYLINQGVAPEMLLINGYGERPIDVDTRNGLVEFKIVESSDFTFEIDEVNNKITRLNFYSNEGKSIYNVLPETLYTDHPISYDKNSINQNISVYNSNLDLIKLLAPKNDFFYDVQTTKESEFIAVDDGTEQKFIKKDDASTFTLDFDGTLSDWSKDGQMVLFFKTNSSDGHQITHSELYIFDLIKKTINQITFSDDLIEINPKFTNDDKVIQYEDYLTGAIKTLNIE